MACLTSDELFAIHARLSARSLEKEAASVLAQWPDSFYTMIERHTTLERAAREGGFTKDTFIFASIVHERNLYGEHADRITLDGRRALKSGSLFSARTLLSTCESALSFLNGDLERHHWAEKNKRWNRHIQTKEAFAKHTNRFERIEANEAIGETLGGVDRIIENMRSERSEAWEAVLSIAERTKADYGNWLPTEHRKSECGVGGAYLRSYLDELRARVKRELTHGNPSDGRYKKRDIQDAVRCIEDSLENGPLWRKPNF